MASGGVLRPNSRDRQRVSEKGGQVYLEGKLTTRKWTDKSGVERYTTEIKVDEMQLMGGRDGGSSGGDDGGYGRESMNERSSGGGRAMSNSAPRAGAQSGGTQNRPSAPAGGGFDEMDDDIPF